ncbi:ankyrin repeat-containing protein BDA1-like [Camellia sinensis]|uniref:ankyrin repeat-containing protein BDA1-like n=1 Tax=Camellia sinensis TaxID=4442 RepID=UPI0010364B73|nr:ankyrin repeat-containing protein BDA1-like [Camellia sinensis]
MGLELGSRMKLIEDNPRLLYTSALENEETPLHIASMVGHFNLVIGIMKLRKEFSQELNEDGLSPLHIASTKGHVEIVKELLKEDHKLCLVKGRERRIPLHYTTIKGRVDVIRELILASADSVVDVAARGEKVLHLAVKNNQFEAFKDLVEHLKKFNKENVLNRKDDQGNTFLHLAVSKKYDIENCEQVIDLVLKKNAISNGALEINSLNKKGLTALDVFPFFQSEAVIREIKEILRQVGVMIAEELHSLTQPGMNQNQAIVAINLSNRDSLSEARHTMLVIVVLIATTTYQTVRSPPGSVWADDSMSSNNNSNNNVSKPRKAGQAIMGSKNCVTYGLLILFNSIGVFTSLQMIYCLTRGFPLQLELQIGMFALIVKSDTCMAAITSNDKLWIFLLLFPPSYDADTDCN